MESILDNIDFLRRKRWVFHGLRASGAGMEPGCPTRSLSESVQSDSVTPWTAARQASLSITNSRSLPKPMSIESVMPSSHLIVRHPLLLPSVFPSIRVFSNESALRIRWPKDWSFSFKVSPSNEHCTLLLDLLCIFSHFSHLLHEVVLNFSCLPCKLLVHVFENR